tara:strand:+ start:200 stop:574 length:375 start_codon:yes stop_codon:yes gene_type:complete
MDININISIGELIDKITILEIKSIKIKDKGKLKNINFELQMLEKELKKISLNSEIIEMQKELYETNLRMWKIEEDIRVYEKSGDFGPKFIELARSVYQENDLRSEIKKNINTLSRSKIIEEKSY